ncbi:hypothetical protein CAOG_00953 [Capsaspora owczarzaki ATCC 30864]|uniref:Bromo domain-containing protein n=1 Tax=Capsaspora owczarzaki (strain ATCC 30864) TaxID=595528 RepID=A0A0D2VHS3_CAPO3|nr:hypothetical protein CAOG_00953 [Capsaspora owczarzaki ATCC 30864]KJE89492.1 hypothetical protein CAOG_000953 [Capsaspora owczarzaki ATCC 30864]|eukprot:XP_004365824.1 hypothetical protein CAOG_00953 [Capsaspora owczarzaki ATCC 30864]
MCDSDHDEAVYELALRMQRAGEWARLLDGPAFQALVFALQSQAHWQALLAMPVLLQPQLRAVLTRPVDVRPKPDSAALEVEMPVSRGPSIMLDSLSGLSREELFALVWTGSLTDEFVAAYAVTAEVMPMADLTVLESILHALIALSLDPVIFALRIRSILYQHRIDDAIPRRRHDDDHERAARASEVLRQAAQQQQNTTKRGRATVPTQFDTAVSDGEFVQRLSAFDAQTAGRYQALVELQDVFILLDDLGEDAELEMDELRRRPVRQHEIDAGTLPNVTSYFDGTSQTGPAHGTTTNNNSNTIIDGNDSDTEVKRLQTARDESDYLEMFNTQCEHIVLTLRNNRDHAYPFLTRVSKRDAPGYYDEIVHPMDFSLIQRKLSSQQYLERAPFEADIRLIYANCRAYNTEDDNVFCAHADALEAITDRLFADWVTVPVPVSIRRKSLALQAKEAQLRHKVLAAFQAAQSSRSEDASDVEVNANQTGADPAVCIPAPPLPPPPPQPLPSVLQTLRQELTIRARDTAQPDTFHAHRRFLRNSLLRTRALRWLARSDSANGAASSSTPDPRLAADREPFAIRPTALSYYPTPLVGYISPVANEYGVAAGSLFRAGSAEQDAQPRFSDQAVILPAIPVSTHETLDLTVLPQAAAKVACPILGSLDTIVPNVLSASDDDPGLGEGPHVAAAPRQTELVFDAEQLECVGKRIFPDAYSEQLALPWLYHPALATPTQPLSSSYSYQLSSDIWTRSPVWANAVALQSIKQRVNPDVATWNFTLPKQSVAVDRLDASLISNLLDRSVAVLLAHTGLDGCDASAFQLIGEMTGRFLENLANKMNILRVTHRDSSNVEDLLVPCLEAVECSPAALLRHGHVVVQGTSNKIRAMTRALDTVSGTNTLEPGASVSAMASEEG